MRVKGNVSPVTLSMESYLPLEGYVEVRLRENIKEVTDIDPQTETSVTMFEYDEYTFLLKNREGLQEDIENNLSDWLITGRTLEVNESGTGNFGGEQIMAQLYIDNAKKLKVRIDNNQKIVDTVEAAGGIETTLTQSDKIGFDWLNFYVNKVLVRQEYKEQENPVGTADNPFVWEKSMALIANGFYVHDGVRKVWVGETGVTAAWDDSNWQVM